MTTTDTPTRRPSARGTLLIAAVVLIVLFGSVFLWRSARSAGTSADYAPPPVEVSAMRVRAEMLPQAIEATGTLRAVREVVLAAEVSGRVTAIGFEAGRHVGPGATLVRLFDAPERADRAAAAARAQFAQIQHERSQELAPTGAEPRQLLEQRQAELAQARAAVQQLDARIAQKTVRAPFAGQIGIRRVNLGQYLNAGDPVATLTALDRLYVNFSVPQQELPRLRVGGTVSVRSDAAPGREFQARINAIEPVVDGETRNISVQAEMPNPAGQLRPGIYVTVGVAQQARAGAILVPNTAVQTSAYGDNVFVVKEGKAAIVPVALGSEVGERIVIESGLKPGDVVVTTGQLRIQPGTAVKVARAPALTGSAAK